MRFLAVCTVVVVMTARAALGEPCAEVYAPGGAWTWTAAEAAAHGCPLCNGSAVLAPPACACPRGSMYVADAAACTPCAGGAFCAGGTSPAQLCPAHSASPPGSSALEDCVCRDAFRATPARGCEPCPPTHICRNGTAVACPADARVHGDQTRCTCVPGTFSVGTNGTCAPCAPGHYCPGGAHNNAPVLCPAHSTSHARAASPAACHCLPPYVGVDHGLAVCVDAGDLAMSLVVRGEDLLALAPGSLALVQAQRCATPGLCPGTIGAQVHNGTHLTLHLFNVIVRPAYLALLYDFLAGAEVLETRYVAVRRAWGPAAHDGVPAWRCAVAVNTTARAGDDPAALHRAAAEARWNALVQLDPVAMAEGPPAAGSLRGQVTWQLAGAHAHSAVAVAEALDDCGVGAAERGAVAVAPDAAGTAAATVSVEGMACPPLAVLACVLGAPGFGGLVPGSAVQCVSHVEVHVRGDAQPALALADACAPGYLATAWNVTAHAERAIAFVANHSDVHVVGTVAVRVAPHAVPTDTSDLLWARNTSAWQAGGEAPHPSVGTLARVFRLLGLGEPHFTRAGRTHGADVRVALAPESGAGHVRVTSTGIFLRTSDVAALLHALQAAVGVDGAPGGIVSMSTTVTGTVALDGAADRVYAAGVATGRLWFDAANASACAAMNATVDAEDLWTSVATSYALLPSTTLLSLLRHTLFQDEAMAATDLVDAATYPGAPPVPAVAFRTRGRGCDAARIRNPAFPDDTLRTVLAHMASGAHVDIASVCQTTCVRDGNLSLGAAHAVARGVRAWNETTASDASATLAWLEAAGDLAAPDLAVAHTAVLATPNASAVAALGLGIWLTSAVAIPASPLGLLAHAGGLGASERDPRTCAGSGCAGRVVVGQRRAAAAGCLDVAARNHGLFVDGVLREARRALATATVLTAAAQRVTATLALPAAGGQSADADVLAQLRALGARVDISPARPWHELRLVGTFAPAPYAPAPEVLRALVWDEVAVQVPGALSQLPHAGETLAFEVALASPIAGLTPDSLWLMQSMIEAELGVLLAGAAVRMLAATTKAEHGLVLVAEASLTRELACAHAWARLARFVENGTVASLQVHAVVVASACRVEVRLRSTADTSAAARALASRALLRPAHNVTWSVASDAAAPFSLVNISTSDLAVFDRVAAALFDTNATVPISHLEHHVRVCGFAGPEQVADAAAHLAEPFGA